jgi:hypothetical protein
MYQKLALLNSKGREFLKVSSFPGKASKNQNPLVVSQKDK